jgi:hypothetical protein
MSEIALTVIKVVYLALLWLFILSAVSVIRSDLFGRTVEPRTNCSRRSWRPACAAAEDQAPTRRTSGVHDLPGQPSGTLCRPR